MTKLIKNGTAVYKILVLISHSNEISPKIFHQCKDFSYKYYMNTVKIMTESCTYANDSGETIENIKALTIIGNGKRKTIRLTRKAYEHHLLNLIDKEAQMHYEVNAYNKYQENANKWMIERNHKIAELFLKLNRNEINHYWIFNEEINPLRKTHNVFLNIRMIKALYISQSARQGRSYGVLIIGGMCYMVYIFDNINAKWSSEAELKSKKITRKAIRENIKNLSNEPDMYFDSAIIFGGNIEMISGLLMGKEANPDIKNGVKIDSTYNNYYYIPEKYADQILSLLKIRDLHEKLKEITFFNQKSSCLIDCDGITDKNEYLLFVFDLNLTRMRRFKRNCEYYKENKYIVYGLDWQKEFLMKYYGESVEILTINYHVLMGAI